MYATNIYNSNIIDAGVAKWQTQQTLINLLSIKDLMRKIERQRRNSLNEKLSNSGKVEELNTLYNHRANRLI